MTTPPDGTAVTVVDVVVIGMSVAGEKLWAVGDVTGHGAFSHVATYQASIAVRDILGQEGPTAEYDAVPRVTFTDPEIGAVGLTEAQARDRGSTSPPVPGPPVARRSAASPWPCMGGSRSTGSDA